MEIEWPTHRRQVPSWLLVLCSSATKGHGGTGVRCAPSVSRCHLHTSGWLLDGGSRPGGLSLPVLCQLSPEAGQVLPLLLFFLRCAVKSFLVIHEVSCSLGWGFRGWLCRGAPLALPWPAPLLPTLPLALPRPPARLPVLTRTAVFVGCYSVFSLLVFCSEGSSSKSQEPGTDQWEPFPRMVCYSVI